MERRQVAGGVLIALGGLVLLASAAAKFARVPPIVAELGAFGFAGSKLMLIAAIEAVSALLFLIPRTRSAGLLLVSSYLGGAIATHVQHDQSVVRSEEHTSELQSRPHLVCRLLLEKKKNMTCTQSTHRLRARSSSYSAGNR